MNFNFFYHKNPSGGKKQQQQHKNIIIILKLYKYVCVCARVYVKCISGF
jgi:hypothetical protein